MTLVERVTDGGMVSCETQKRKRWREWWAS